MASDEVVLDNRQILQVALDRLQEGLDAFVRDRFLEEYGDHADPELLAAVASGRTSDLGSLAFLDAGELLKAMTNRWATVFSEQLEIDERGIAYELRGVRNSWAHQPSVSDQDLDRALDSMLRILGALPEPHSSRAADARAQIAVLVHKRSAKSVEIEVAKAARVEVERLHADFEEQRQRLERGHKEKLDELAREQELAKKERQDLAAKRGLHYEQAIKIQGLEQRVSQLIQELSEVEHIGSDHRGRPRTPADKSEATTGVLQRRGRIRCAWKGCKETEKLSDPQETIKGPRRFCRQHCEEFLEFRRSKQRQTSLR